MRNEYYLASKLCGHCLAYFVERPRICVGLLIYLCMEPVMRIYMSVDEYRLISPWNFDNGMNADFT